MLLHKGAVKRRALCILLLSASTLCSVTRGCLSCLTHGSLSRCQCCKKAKKRNQRGREYFLMVRWNTFIIYNNPPPLLAPVFSHSVRNGPVRLMGITLTWFTMILCWPRSSFMLSCSLKKTKSQKQNKKKTGIRHSVWVSLAECVRWKHKQEGRLSGDTDILSLLNKRINGDAAAEASVCCVCCLSFIYFLVWLSIRLWPWRNEATSLTQNALSRASNNTK